MPNSNALLLVGSIPLETSEDVFTWVRESGLNKYLHAVPDGEVGERIYWIPMLSYRVYHGHPDIDTTKRPKPVGGVESWRPKDAEDAWSFRLKPNVSEIHFGDLGWRLGYSRDAINSYFVFKTFKDQGIIEQDARFQVSLPFTYSGFAGMFPVEDWPIMTAAYEEAMLAELATITSHIPASELTIQWDCCVELAMVEQTGIRSEADTRNWKRLNAMPLELVSGAIARLGPAVPKDANLGYHLCYGTLGGWPMRSGDDLGMAVKMIDAILDHSGRRVDYVHIPVLDNAPAEYFEPLQNIRRDEKTRYYFGAIHNMNNEEDFRHKLSQIGQHVTDFGIAAPCGFGRQGNLENILKEHRLALKIYHDQYIT